MSPQLRRQIMQEVDLIQRFSQAYGRKFHELIERLNGSPPPSDPHCMRLCVEAVDMMLATQGQLARVLGALSRD